MPSLSLLLLARVCVYRESRPGLFKRVGGMRRVLGLGVLEGGNVSIMAATLCKPIL